MQTDTHQQQMPRFTWRLTYAYRQHDVKLVRAQHVQMIAPPPVGDPPAQGQSGSWVEVRGSGDKLLYHRVLSELIPQDREVFSNEPGRTIHRVPVKATEGEFEVLVPDMPGAKHLVLHGNPPGAPRAAAAQVIARAEFKELAKLQSSH